MEIKASPLTLFSKKVMPRFLVIPLITVRHFKLPHKSTDLLILSHLSVYIAGCQYNL